MAEGSLLDLAALGRTKVASQPFDHLIVPGFIPAIGLQQVERDFPRIDKPGSFPLSTISGYGPTFMKLMEALQGPALRQAIAEKFSLDLTGRPTMVTVRGRCRRKDGQIHVDSKDKIITVLLYLNESWGEEGGRLRLLRNACDLDDYAVEVPPDAGTMLAFRCTPDAWHGHKPFEGDRRVIQLNWVTSNYYVWREQARHKLSAWSKRFLSAA